MSDQTDVSAVPVEAETTSAAVRPPTSPTQSEGDPMDRQQALLAMGRRAISPPNTSILMLDAAALLAETLGAEYSAVAEFSADGKSLHLVLTETDRDRPETDVDPAEAEAKKPATFVHETPAGGNDSLAAYALQVAHPVVTFNLPRDDRFSDRFLCKHGIQSAVAVPLQLSDRSFGSLIACSTEAREFGDEDILFAETIAHLAATSAGKKEAEESLAEERRFTAEVLQTVDAIVLVLDSQWQIVRINQACERVTGFSLEEIKNRPIWNVLPISEEVDLFRNLKEKLKGGSRTVEYESYLLTKHSERRLIAWSYSAMTGSGGEIESIIATGIDITEQQEAKEQTEQAKNLARESQRAVAKLMGREWKEPEDGDIDAFGRLPVPLNAERRTATRRAYPYKQKIAPMSDGKLPKREEFVEVECHDISGSGFSFLCQTPPPCDAIVAELGLPPKLNYMSAQITHITRIEHNGRRMFLVGCSYSGRAVY